MKQFLTFLIVFEWMVLSATGQDHPVRLDTGSMVDPRDSQTYAWIRVGNVVWMAENLNFKTNLGSSCYHFDTIHCQVYGRLYEWKSAREVCPPGWHLPDLADWDELVRHFGDQAGDKLKKDAPELWTGPAAVVTGDSGFDALPAGYKGLDPFDRPIHQQLGEMAFFWTTATGTPASKGLAKVISSIDEEVKTIESWKLWGYSVRCVKRE